MASSSNGPPPAYGDYYREMQDPGEYSYPGDTNILIPEDDSQKRQPPPPYTAAMSTTQWPEGGGYVPQGPGGEQPCVINPAMQGQQQQLPGTITDRRQTVTVCQNRNSTYQDYLRTRMAICCGFIVVKAIIFAVVLAFVMSN